MSNEELAKYFGENIDKGHLVKELRETALKHGHSKDDINEAMKLANLKYSKKIKKQTKIKEVFWGENYERGILWWIYVLSFFILFFSSFKSVILEQLLFEQTFKFIYYYNLIIDSLNYTLVILFLCFIILGIYFTFKKRKICLLFYGYLLLFVVPIMLYFFYIIDSEQDPYFRTLYCSEFCQKIPNLHYDTQDEYRSHYSVFKEKCYCINEHKNKITLRNHMKKGSTLDFGNGSTQYNISYDFRDKDDIKYTVNSITHFNYTNESN